MACSRTKESLRPRSQATVTCKYHKELTFHDILGGGTIKVVSPLYYLPAATVAAPPISPFINAMLLEGLREMPPLHNPNIVNELSTNVNKKVSIYSRIKCNTYIINHHQCQSSYVTQSLCPFHTHTFANQSIKRSITTIVMNLEET